MLRFFLMLLLSWSVSSWLLAETFFFFPSIKPVVAMVESMIAIPRHDKWDMDRVYSESQRIQTDIDKSSTTKFLSSLFGAPEASNSRKVARRGLTTPIVFDEGNSLFDSFSDRKVIWWQPSSTDA